MAATMTIIECGKCYRLPDFLKITNMGDRALREAKDRGLRVTYSGRIGWVRGDDFHAYLGKLAEEQGGTDGTQQG